MRAIVMDGYGGPEVLVARDMPAPKAGAGEVLVRVRAVAVNPADGKWRAGMFAEFAPVSFPHILGYDIAGEVIGGDGFAVGERVFGMLDPFRKGGYAEQVAVAAAQLATIPDGMDEATAAAIPTAGLTGLQVVEDVLDVAGGQRILITGASGAVGRSAMHAARGRGAIVIAAVRESQRQAALDLGADEVVAIGGADRSRAHVDHVIDTVGGAEVAALCRALRPGGRIITVATTPIPAEGLPAMPEMIGVRPDGAQTARLAQAVRAGEIAVPIARRLPLDQAAEAQRLVEAGGAGGKIILIP